VRAGAKFLTAYASMTSPPIGWYGYGTFVNPDASLGSCVSINHANLDVGRPTSLAVAWDPDHDIYLAVWEHHFELSQIYVALLDGSGNLVHSIMISPMSATRQFAPKVAYVGSGDFLVVWGATQQYPGPAAWTGSWSRGLISTIPPTGTSTADWLTRALPSGGRFLSPRAPCVSAVPPFLTAARNSWLPGRMTGQTATATSTGSSSRMKFPFA